MYDAGCRQWHVLHAGLCAYNTANFPFAFAFVARTHTHTGVSKVRTNYAESPPCSAGINKTQAGCTDAHTGSRKSRSPHDCTRAMAESSRCGTSSARSPQRALLYLHTPHTAPKPRAHCARFPPTRNTCFGTVPRLRPGANVIFRETRARKT